MKPVFIALVQKPEIPHENKSQSRVSLEYGHKDTEWESVFLPKAISIFVTSVTGHTKLIEQITCYRFFKFQVLPAVALISQMISQMLHGLWLRHSPTLEHHQTEPNNVY